MHCCGEMCCQTSHRGWAATAVQDQDRTSTARLSDGELKIKLR
ncbi:hypothetical protein BOO71_0014842 [Deinococcus marmoris]|uniref:Uncharacterized protein n=1 Tax=Deinococcus marmoris TaxID=249408 RepID=A0A1U7NRB1_9DEIO|nr:hypothetical protein BOO71_0014842 [Deinococcus marmoris]